MAMDAAWDSIEPIQRTSDAEREAVIQRLGKSRTEGRIAPEELHERSQAVYAARTRAELAQLTLDLPGTDDAPSPAAADRPATAAPIVAMFAGTERRGRWRPARRETAVAMFGGVALDFREAELPPDELELRAYAVFGGIEISVPDGVRVERAGFSIFGGRTVKTGGAPPASGTPVLRLNAVAVFGGVSVKAEPLRRD